MLLNFAGMMSLFLKCVQEYGKESQEKKKNHMKALLVSATDCEPQYLIRLLQVEIVIFIEMFWWTYFLLIASWSCFLDKVANWLC